MLYCITINIVWGTSYGYKSEACSRYVRILLMLGICCSRRGAKCVPSAVSVTL